MGGDVAASGFSQLVTGRPSKSFTEQDISRGLQTVGMSAQQADQWAGNADAGISIVGSGYSGGTIVRGAPAVSRSASAVGGAAKGVAYSDDLVKAAQKLYPNKAGKIELHHPFPKYMGGAEKQVLVPLDAAYHQQITNEFFKYWPKKLPGQPRVYPTAQQAQEIMQKVYSKFPLPGN